MPWKKIEPMNQRKEFVLKAIHTRNFRQLCEEYGISTKTGYKWRERFFEKGLEGMAELSRRPQGHANELEEVVVCEIIRLKNAHRSWGARKLRTFTNDCTGRCLARAVLSGSWSGRDWWRNGGWSDATKPGGYARVAKPVP